MRDGGVYRERGGDYFDLRNPARTAKKLTERLERIGFEVVVKLSPLSPVPPKDVVPAESAPSVIGGDSLNACTTSPDRREPIDAANLKSQSLKVGGFRRNAGRTGTTLSLPAIVLVPPRQEVVRSPKYSIQRPELSDIPWRRWSGRERSEF
jgi:hypothetical protein